jgi:2,4-dichlorophenol 6-monooxygenase
MKIKHTVDVLVVGGGGSGLTASMLLSSYGVSSYLVSKYPTTSRLPKASGLAIKTMEIFRELGLEDAVRARATPPEHLRFTGIYAGLAGPHPDYGRPIVRLPYWEFGGEDADWRAASSVRPANLMQSQLEPLMKARAEALAPGSIFFNHSLLSFEGTGSGIVATIEDRATREVYQVAARYLLGCDGGRVVGPQLGVEMEGHLAVATSVSVHFSADLSPWVKDADALLKTLINPDVGLPCALVSMGPDNWGAHSEEWVAHLLSFSGDHKAYDDATAIAMMRRCLGLHEVPIEVHLVNRWPLDAVVASKYRFGHAFLLGDAAHRMPPAGGHGLNTAIQDAYNLCWKLAAVLKGHAAEALLDTYERERRPVAQHNVATAFKGWQNNKPMAAALGVDPNNDASVNWANVRKTWEPGEAGDAARLRLARVVPGVVPNGNPLHLAFGYTYHDGAVVSDEVLAPFLPEPLGIFQPSTRPGHSLPDRWVESLVDRKALGDLVGRGHFVLIAGAEGHGWVDAAVRVAKERSIALDAFTVGGTEGDWLDSRGGWKRVQEFGPGGAILVRPDRFIAWRSMDASTSAVAEMHAAFDHLFRAFSD